MANEILLTSDGAQTFTTILNGVNYQVDVSYNTRMNKWFMSLSSNNQKLVSGIGLMLGVDIVDQYNLDIDRLIVVNLDNPNVDAGPDNLGTSVRLFQVTDQELIDVNAI